MTSRDLIECNVVRVLDLEPIPVAEGDGASLRFRIEVLEDARATGRFHLRVLRFETFRLQPTFPQKRGKPALPAADEDVLVVDTSHEWNKIIGSTPDEVVQGALAKLRDRLGISRPGTP